MAYVYEQPQWPWLTWRDDRIATLLAEVRHRQGVLIGRMQSLGFPLKTEATLRSLTDDVVKSSEIEGEILDREQVRSSIARRLGLDIGGLVPSDRDVDGVVDMMLDATQNHDRPLDAERLFTWHATLFPGGRSGMSKITVGGWRSDASGPMQVVSGPVGRERIHFQAPPAGSIPDEMLRFLAWFEGEQAIDPVVKAGVAHLWFVTLHPFDDGNGRIARAIADMQLARSEQSPQRFYSMSSQIRLDRSTYYRMLETTQSGGLDVTPWLIWFLDCLDAAIARAGDTLAAVTRKARFWERHAGIALNRRQRDMINRLLDGFRGKLTTSKWAKLEKCSQDTALRDIDGLLRSGILTREVAGGRSTSYALIAI